MSLQIFLYQGFAGLYEELSTIQIKGGNIWNTPRDMTIYICINIFICAEQIVPQILRYQMKTWQPLGFHLGGGDQPRSQVPLLLGPLLRE